MKDALLPHFRKDKWSHFRKDKWSPLICISDNCEPVLRQRNGSALLLLLYLAEVSVIPWERMPPHKVLVVKYFVNTAALKFRMKTNGCQAFILPSTTIRVAY